MRLPDPIANTTTEAYLAYKAGVLAEGDLKPKLYEPYIHLDAWLAYWAGLTTDYPSLDAGKNLLPIKIQTGSTQGIEASYDSETGMITVSGTPTVEWPQLNSAYSLEKPILAGSRITFSSDGFPSGIRAVFIRFYGKEGSTHTDHSISSSSHSSTFTVESDCYRVMIIIRATSDTTSDTGYASISGSFGLQMEYSERATSFERYTGDDPEMLTDEEAYIAYLSGVTDTYPEEFRDPADIRVAAYLRYLISARFGRPEYPVTNEELYLSMLKTKYIPSGDPSSDIVIDGTAKAPFVDVKMYGDTFQQTYTGKNLLKLSDGSTTLGGVPITTTNGTVNLKGTATSGEQGYYVTINITASEPMVFSTNKSGTTSGLDIKLQYKRSGTVYYPSVGSSLSLQAGDIIQQMYLIISNGSVLDGSFSPMLEAGSTATAFEPFVGGQPSPSPSYPQQIQTVTGTQTVTVTSKNLFSGQNLTEDSRVSTSNGVTYDRDGYEVSDYIEIEPSTNYALTCGNAQNGSYFSWYDSTKTYISGSGWQNKTVKTSPANASYIRFDFLASEVGIVQFEKGSVSSYVPYSNVSYPINLGTIELCKLGDYQDYIWKDGEDWKVHKEIGHEKKIVSLAGIDGYSSVYGTATTSNGAFAIISHNWGSDYATTAGLAIASSVIGVYQSQNIDGNNTANSMADGTFCQRAGTNDRIYFRVAAWARSKTVNEVNQMVTDNDGIDLWYPLATPTDTTITDTNLIAQLDSLVNGGAEDGTTYIKVNATDPNLPAKLYVEAPKYE